MYEYSEKLKFNGKNVLVTGGASGIGRATAQAFALQGANVIILDINTPVAGSVVDTICELGGQASSYEVDVSTAEEVEGVAGELGALYGEIHILVNNAGIEYNDRGNIISMPYADLTRILQVNLFGYMHCVRAFVPIMPRGGRIVQVSSVQGLGAHRPGTSYQVAKSAILGLTRSLAIELAEREITVNTVAPGAIATEGMGNVRSGEQGIVDRYRRRIPLGRRGHVEEVAGPILFLCSELACYITGTVLLVDGGYMIQLTPDTGEPITHYTPDDPDHTF